MHTETAILTKARALADSLRHAGRSTAAALNECDRQLGLPGSRDCGGNLMPAAAKALVMIHIGGLV